MGIHEKVVDARRRPVLKYDSNGDFIKEYPSTQDAAITEGLSPATLHSYCKQSQSFLSCRGFLWRFKKSTNFPMKIEPPSKGNYKKIMVTHIKTGEIQKFDYIAEAAAATKTSKNSIHKYAISGKPYKDYIWAYDK